MLYRMVSASVWVMKSLTCIPAQLLTGHFSFSLPPIKWLKTKHFAFLYFWKSKVQTQLHWAKTKMSKELVAFESSKKAFILLSSPSCSSHLYFLLQWMSLQSVHAITLSSLLSVPNFSLPPIYKSTCNCK